MRKEIMVSDLEYCVMWVSCNFFVFCIVKIIYVVLNLYGMRGKIY